MIEKPLCFEIISHQIPEKLNIQIFHTVYVQHTPIIGVCYFKYVCIYSVVSKLSHLIKLIKLSLVFSVFSDAGHSFARP